MATFTVYILHSPLKGKYYVGHTSMAIEERLRRHNSNHSGFTGKENDWIVVKTIILDSKQEALKLEKEIKKRGAARWLLS